MEQITAVLLLWVAQFALILIRLAALFTISPIFGRANLPNTAKIMFSVILSILVINLVPPGDVLNGVSLPGFVFMCLSELVVGLSLGFLTTVFFSVVFTAGQIIDTQIGFGMVQVYDVQSNVQIPISGSLLNMVLLISAMVSGGHLRLIQILTRTFETIPVGQAHITAETGLLVLDAFTKSFVLAIQVAMPIIASGLLAEIALGVVVRTAPQMNIFVIGIPIKTIIGLIMLILVVPTFTVFTSAIFDSMYNSIDALFLSMA